MKTSDAINNRISDFIYTFRWDKYIFLFDNNIIRYSFYVPIFGYIIIFNDEITNNMKFFNLTNNIDLFYFSTDLKIKFIYFGLTFLAVAHALYLCFRPNTFKFGKNIDDFLRNYMQICTPLDYKNILDRIEKKGAYSSGAENFISIARQYIENFFRSESETTQNNNPLFHHNTALVFLLKDHFYYKSTRKRFVLLICILFSVFGYALFFISSFDLLQAVVRTTIRH